MALAHAGPYRLFSGNEWVKAIPGPRVRGVGQDTYEINTQHAGKKELWAVETLEGHYIFRNVASGLYACADNFGVFSSPKSNLKSNFFNCKWHVEELKNHEVNIQVPERNAFWTVVVRGDAQVQTVAMALKLDNQTEPQRWTFKLASLD